MTSFELTLGTDGLAAWVPVSTPGGGGGPTAYPILNSAVEPDADNPGTFLIPIVAVPAGSMIVIFGATVETSFDDSSGSQAVGDARDSPILSNFFSLRADGANAHGNSVYAFVRTSALLSYSGLNGDGTQGVATLWASVCTP